MLQDFLKTHGVETAPSGHHHHSRRRGYDVGTDCPSCTPDSGSFRLGWSIRRGSCNCWNCGKLNPSFALSDLCKISVREAKQFWKHLVGSERFVFEQEVRTGKLELPSSGPLLPAHRNYLESRGFDPEEIVQDWNVTGIGPTGGRLSWRILIPIHDARGKIVSWTTRSIVPDAERRYITADLEHEAVSHKSLLYGAFLASQSVVVVEGPINVWRIGAGAVATCGVAITQEQIRKIAKFPRRFICMDAQPDAQKTAIRLCEKLSEFPGVTKNLLLETGKDAAEADPEEIEDIRRRLER